ncbi:phosphoribosyltransferase [bacterium]|nr:phosphoribosyltransferase [bacterium]
MSDVFFCHKTLPKNVEYIIICDDVTTTGATLQALAFAIQQVNPHVRIR